MMSAKDLLRKANKGIHLLRALQDHYIYPKSTLGYHSLSFSQEGEDQILHRIFERQNQGFYVDVGAHHP